ncbi:hypothetical protein ACFW04_007562 [Cataglyphis niger]
MRANGCWEIILTKFKNLYVEIFFSERDEISCENDKNVSWIKRKNVQELLTVGLTTYANDERFQAIHFHHSEDWTLQIKYVQPRDAGIYECQSTEVPLYIFWYHNIRMINYDVDQGVNVSTDLANRESWLEVPRASDRHSGNYTCKANNAQPARVLVHVFKGDNPAAMQHSMASNGDDTFAVILDRTTSYFVRDLAGAINTAGGRNTAPKSCESNVFPYRRPKILYWQGLTKI